MSVYSAGRKIGVVLFQLGGPDSLEAIEPFLYNLFCDPDIIDFPFARIARQPLARLISATRARHVRRHYAEIGGRSPILEFTRRCLQRGAQNRGRSFSAWRAGFARSHRTVSLQSVLRSGYHRLSVRAQ